MTPQQEILVGDIMTPSQERRTTLPLSKSTNRGARFFFACRFTGSFLATKK
jgi:hypothetical protein